MHDATRPNDQHPGPAAVLRHRGGRRLDRGIGLRWQTLPRLRRHRDLAALARCLTAAPELFDSLAALPAVGQVDADMGSMRSFCEERAAFLKDARTKAGAEVNKAKERVAEEFGAAKKEIEAGTADLAAEIARRVLRVPPASPTREAR